MHACRSTGGCFSEKNYRLFLVNLSLSSEETTLYSSKKLEKPQCVEQYSVIEKNNRKVSERMVTSLKHY